MAACALSTPPLFIRTLAASTTSAFTLSSVIVALITIVALLATPTRAAEQLPWGETMESSTFTFVGDSVAVVPPSSVPFPEDQADEDHVAATAARLAKAETVQPPDPPPNVVGGSTNPYTYPAYKSDFGFQTAPDPERAPGNYGPDATLASSLDVAQTSVQQPEAMPVPASSLAVVDSLLSQVQKTLNHQLGTQPTAITTPTTTTTTTTPAAAPLHSPADRAELAQASGTIPPPGFLLTQGAPSSPLEPPASRGDTESRGIMDTLGGALLGLTGYKPVNVTNRCWGCFVTMLSVRNFVGWNTYQKEPMLAEMLRVCRALDLPFQDACLALYDEAVRQEDAALIKAAASAKQKPPQLPKRTPPPVVGPDAGFSSIPNPEATAPSTYPLGAVLRKIARLASGEPLGPDEDPSSGKKPGFFTGLLNTLSGSSSDTRKWDYISDVCVTQDSKGKPVKNSVFPPNITFCSEGMLWKMKEGGYCFSGGFNGDQQLQLCKNVPAVKPKDNQCCPCGAFATEMQHQCCKCEYPYYYLLDRMNYESPYLWLPWKGGDYFKQFCCPCGPEGTDNHLLCCKCTVPFVYFLDESDVHDPTKAKVIFPFRADETDDPSVNPYLPDDEIDNRIQALASHPHAVAVPSTVALAQQRHK
eukprot:gnl/Spiro4/2880_TR1416_c0_g1_i1.p1 gnl/Spiro4/2880_TR1416_c0_g1~~gnl/Spiro4/2880_TR1416_c0_g1_i1.p1  ORF type:complete len:643 (-),score=147.86 gnl/Spiro4/2880_TR1416_c0_g1_i1:98-2026(-)